MYGSFTSQPLTITSTIGVGPPVATTAPPLSTEPATWPSILIGPLTTTFTPPSPCISSVYAFTTDLPGGTFSNWMHLGPPGTEQCLPSGWGPSAYYSPAQCPSGYSANIVTTINSETQAVCCPSVGESTYSLHPETGAELMFTTELCQTQPSTGTTYFPLTYFNDFAGTWTDIPGSIASTDTINAFGISIRWREGDFPASNIATPTAAHSSEHNAAASNELSSGAKAGIGVGVGVGGLSFGGLAFAFFFWRRKRRGTARDTSQDQQDTAEAHHEPDFGGNHYELPASGQEILELPGGQAQYDNEKLPPAELPADTVPESSLLKPKIEY